MTGYQDTMPCSLPSARSGASMEPISNRRSGYALRFEIDHHRQQVDAEGVQLQFQQVRSEVPRAASELGDEPGAGCPHGLGERGRHHTLQRKGVE